MIFRCADRWLALLVLAIFAAAPCRGQTLYVCCDGFPFDGDDGIYQVSPAGAKKVFPQPVNSGNGGVAVDSHGNLYVSTHLGGTKKDQLIKITPDGTASVFADAPNVLHLACDAHDNLYDVENGAEIFRFTPAGQKSFVAKVPTGEEPELCGLAVDQRGNLYVSARGPRPERVVKITPSGRQSVFAVLPDASPRGLAFDARGNLYVASLTHPRVIKHKGGDETYAELPSRIFKFTPDGKRSTFAVIPDSGPHGLAFDAHGNLYAADFAGSRIFKINASGSAVTILTTSIPEPSDLVCKVPPAPEKAAR